MLANIADRKENLTRLESNMVLLDRNRQAKEEELRVLERKLVVLLEEQQNELESIRRRQERKGEALIEGKTSVLTTATGGGGGFAGPSAKDKRQAAQLMQSTETLMKFGFMSMSMTYFSSLNMVRAMRTVAATDTVMAAVHENSTKAAMVTGGGGGGGGGGGAPQGGLDNGLDGGSGNQVRVYEGVREERSDKDRDGRKGESSNTVNTTPVPARLEARSDARPGRHQGVLLERPGRQQVAPEH